MPDEWKEGIDEDVLKVVDRFNEPQDLAKGYVELHKKFSSSPKIPSEDADEETWNKFYDKLGRPEKPDAYEFKKDNLPEEFPWDEEFEKSMKQAAHQAGVNTKQFNALAEKFLEYNGSSFMAAQEASKTAQESALKELKETWKDDFEKNVNIAKHAVKAVDDEEGTITKYLESTGLGDDPVFIKLFNGIGLKILDDTLVQGIKTAKKTEKPKGQFESEFHERYGKGDNS